MNTCSCWASSMAFNTAQNLNHKTALATTQTIIIPVAKNYTLKPESTISEQTVLSHMHIRSCV